MHNFFLFYLNGRTPNWESFTLSLCFVVLWLHAWRILLFDVSLIASPFLWNSITDNYLHDVCEMVYVHMEHSIFLADGNKKNLRRLIAKKSDNLLHLSLKITSRKNGS